MKIPSNSVLFKSIRTLSSCVTVKEITPAEDPNSDGLFGVNVVLKMDRSVSLSLSLAGWPPIFYN